MPNSMFSRPVPVSEIRGLGRGSARYMKMNAKWGIYGAAAGAAASWVSGDDSMARDTALGAGVGMVAMGGLGSRFMRGLESGGVSGGLSRMAKTLRLLGR